LNLKLDNKYKRKWFGNVKGALGNNEFYELKGNLMNFGKTTKYYFLSGLNNTGIDITGDLRKLTERETFHFDKVKAPELLSLPGHQLYLRKTRTNFNKARLASINAIFKPIDSLEIKPLILFNYDRNRF